MTDERIEGLCEDFERLLELHDEYEEAVDLDDGETRACWEEIVRRLDHLSPRIEKLRDADPDDKQLIDGVEVLLEELDEAYGDLAELI
ncbi:MAG: hypothetical protein JRG86_08680 [Deltaproteobacteria bacterium]|jgi:hypothetical protein|nr:hypothetical protein [Deltaproteobacteria bacterium]MBW2501152.1 hypothetical protein [Deltaproteobacteria bacterium]